jgi:hypothetical protein
MMKKQSMLIFALVIGVTTARAQASSTTIEYKKNRAPAFVIELPNTTGDVESMILEKLKQAGYNPNTTGHLFWKNNKKDGFYSFDKVSFPTLSPRKLDLFFKIVPKNTQEKNNSTVYMLVSTGNGYFSSAEQDPDVWNWAQSFINNFPEWTTVYAFETGIIQQEAALADSKKKMISLQNDEQELSNKIKKFQENLVDNRVNQSDLQKDIDNKVKGIERLRMQRTNVNPAVKVVYPDRS